MYVFYHTLGAGTIFRLGSKNWRIFRLGEKNWWKTNPKYNFM